MKRLASCVPFLAAGLMWGTQPNARPGAERTIPAPPTIAYTIRLDPAHLDLADVTIRLQGAPPSLQLAMKVHAEYDARYWRFVEGVRVDGTNNDAAAGVAREDSTLWRVTLPGGHGTVHYRVRIQPPPAGLRRAWMPYARADGAMLNGPDFFLYAVEFPHAPVTLTLDVPSAWKVATALSSRGSPTRRSAPDATTLLDSPIMLGRLRTWSFAERGTTYHVAYWPLPDAAPFDTTAFVHELHQLTTAVLGVFGRAPSREFWFLIQDGASDALEHGASVTIGVPSARLALDPRASLQEITHEFFHTWNLVAVRPVHFNELSYRPPARTPLLWLGEGVTLYYADALPRRAGLAAPAPTRLEHLGSLLERYFASPATLGVSPERASLAFDDSYLDNRDATGGYYLQGELLGHVLDARVREATQDRRGLDDVMRALYERHGTARDSGITSQDVVREAGIVCKCDIAGLFATQVGGSARIDLAPALRRIGLVAVVDSASATDAGGRALPDTRISADFSRAPPRVVISNPASAWAAAGLATGDELVAINGSTPGTFSELLSLLQRMAVGDSALVDIRRNGRPMRVAVSLVGYARPRVRFIDVAGVTREQLARRNEWLAGK